MKGAGCRSLRRQGVGEGIAPKSEEGERGYEPGGNSRYGRRCGRRALVLRGWWR